MPSSAEDTTLADAQGDVAVRALVAACEARIASGACARARGRAPGEECCCELVRPAPSGGPVELVDRPVQLRGSALARAAMGLAGWRVNFDGLPARQGVVVVYPHTSNWDFVWGLLAKWAIGFPLVFWAKHTLFEVPLLGRFVRRVGGIAIDRRAPRGVVGDMAQRLRDARSRDAFMWLAVAPEGTRGRVDGWRSGFYHVALQAQVPVAVAYIDYARKEVGVRSAWRLGGDAEADFACFARQLEGRVGRKPANAGPIRLA